MEFCDSALFNIIFFWVIANGLSNPSVTDEEQLMLDNHNHHRATVKPCPPETKLPKLTWNHKLAKAAKMWADKCEKRSPSSEPSFVKDVTGIEEKVGDNFLSLSAGCFDAKFAMDRWASESEHYDYCNNKCAGLGRCKNYQQMVWDETTEVGCGKTTCRQGPAIGRDIFVCYYLPAAQWFMGRRPYLVSKARFDSVCNKTGQRSFEDCDFGIDEDTVEKKNNLDEDPSISKSKSSKLEKPLRLTMTVGFLFALVQFAMEL